MIRIDERATNGQKRTCKWTMGEINRPYGCYVSDWGVRGVMLGSVEKETKTQRQQLELWREQGMNECSVRCEEKRDR